MTIQIENSLRNDYRWTVVSVFNRPSLLFTHKMLKKSNLYIGSSVQLWVPLGTKAIPVSLVTFDLDCCTLLGTSPTSLVLLQSDTEL